MAMILIILDSSGVETSGESDSYESDDSTERSAIWLCVKFLVLKIITHRKVADLNIIIIIITIIISRYEEMLEVNNQV